MKTRLPPKSRHHQERIQAITDIIVKAANNKIAFVILFGSLARGDWVYDHYVENGVRYSYASDYDILVVTKHKKHSNGYSSIKFKSRIEKEIDKAGLNDDVHKVHIIVESIDRLNKELEKSQYFFSDIKNEGILLYDSKERQLAEPRELSKEERQEIAKSDYDYWLNKATKFFRQTRYAFNDEDYEIAAFDLHQVTESLYNCALLVLTGDKPKSHNLIELSKLAASQSNQFLTIFPKATKEQEKCFELLCTAYSEGRYSKSYIITKEQLEYLMERVEKLKEVVIEACEKILI
jgi:predicted nucleotidyltransferase/HEPN domain-containing protein